MARAIYLSTYVNGISTWNGSQWIPMGSGSNGAVSAMISRDSDLVVCGTFTAIGEAAASLVARWTKGCCDGLLGNVNYSNDDVADLSDLSVLISYLINPGSVVISCLQEADLNGGGVDLTDLSLLVAYFTQRPGPTLPACP